MRNRGKKFGWAGAVGVVVLGALCSVSWADSYRLKNGKVINGTVVEETDEYVKIDEGKNVMKIRKNLLDGFVSKAPATAVKTDNALPQDSGQTLSDKSSHPASSATDDQVVGWEGWYMTSSYYLDQVSRNIAATEAINMEGAFLAVKNRRLSPEDALGAKVEWCKGARVEVLKLSKAFQAVTPPPEFAQYHKKIIEYQNFLARRMQAYIYQDLHNIVRYHTHAFSALIAALQEQRALFKKHRAPAEYIEKLEKQIKLYEQQKEEGAKLVNIDSGKEINFYLPSERKKE